MSSPTETLKLKEAVKQLARQHGFPLVGIASAERFVEAEQSLLERIAAGFFAGLSWFTAERARFCCEPRNHMADACSLIALGISYNALAAPAASGLRGRVARYAWGRDYHHELGERLKKFCRDLRTICPPGIKLKTFVDHGRIVDRAVAQRAGLGWYGKNSNILTHQFGSWVFLAEVLTNLPLPPDAPVRTHCGHCQVCIPACPTGAIVAPGVIHSDRCISFLTIELRGPIPRALRPLIGDWIFGCDVCQDVCPVNRKAAVVAPSAFAPEHGVGARPELLPLLGLSDQEFRQRFGHTPLSRAGRRGLLRNVCVALGNLGDPVAIPALQRALGDPEPLVRGHAAWALGQLAEKNPGCQTYSALQERLSRETDGWVREEIALALRLAQQETASRSSQASS
ncbi:MAG TPA: tRNA epoxyqueuosine(34) reductase QueG [Chloroflexota bacterium]|nr:tRNA epoxyqueuosine(34) reductase QueG [Chloroflexota bacterium]